MVASPEILYSTIVANPSAFICCTHAQGYLIARICQVIGKVIVGVAVKVSHEDVLAVGIVKYDVAGGVFPKLLLA